jgi:NAD+ kinase
MRGGRSVAESEGNGFEKLALLSSDSEKAQEAVSSLERMHPWVPVEEADAVVVIGGDGYMLHVLHQMIDSGRLIPAYGMNLGTVGFLMNRNRGGARLLGRINEAKRYVINPLRMEAVTQNGETRSICAINEVSLLRETRQTAKIEVSVDERVRIEELVCDGVLVSTPAGSTAYNLSANGPILPLDSKLLALTPISPFRPRRWSGAVLPDRSTLQFRIREPRKRPVSVVADQKELREVAEVHVAVAKETRLELLFDPGHSLDERITAEQFMA